MPRAQRCLANSFRASHLILTLYYSTIRFSYLELPNRKADDDDPKIEYSVQDTEF